MARSADDLRQLVAERVKPLFGCCDARIFVVDDTGERHRNLIAERPSVTLSEGGERLQSAGSDWLPHRGSFVEYDIRRCEQVQSPLVICFDEAAEKFSDYRQLKAMKNVGCKESLAALLRVGDERIGIFYLDSLDANFFTPAQFPLFQSIADLIALAVSNVLANEEVARLSEERRRRAAQLAKANDALKRNLDSLAQQPQLNAFLQSVVNEAARQTQAADCRLFLSDDAARTLSLSVSADDGAPQRKAADDEIWKQPIPAAAAPGWNLLLKQKTPLIHNVEQGSDLLWSETQAWYRQHGYTRVICALLRLSEKSIGFMGLAFREGATFTPEEVELVQALANQATLAITLNRLAEKSKTEAREAATLEERNRIAREIHDTLAQGFTGVIVQLETAKRVFGAKTPPKVVEHLDRSINLAREGLAEARRSVQALRPPAAELQLDLAALLREKLEALTADTEIETEFTTSGTKIELLPETTINLLRIGGEVITNALRYSKAKNIRVKLDYENGVSLSIRDDGGGFDVAAKERNGGFGLRGMRERAAAIKADFTVSSDSNNGTEIKVIVNERD